MEEALRDLWMVTAVPGIGMPGGGVLCPNLVLVPGIYYPLFQSSFYHYSSLLPNFYANREYGLVLLLYKVGL